MFILFIINELIAHNNIVYDQINWEKRNCPNYIEIF
jgi:hypothetical protein